VKTQEGGENTRGGAGHAAAGTINASTGPEEKALQTVLSAMLSFGVRQVSTCGTGEMPWCTMCAPPVAQAEGWAPCLVWTPVTDVISMGCSHSRWHTTPHLTTHVPAERHHQKGTPHADGSSPHAR
jgi:hypothetical protein